MSLESGMDTPNFSKSGLSAGAIQTWREAGADSRSPELRQQAALQEQAEIIAKLHRDLSKAWETNGALLLQLTGLQKKAKALEEQLEQLTNRPSVGKLDEGG